MGCQVSMIERVWVGSFNDSRGSELCNGDVIWMPVCSVCPECDYHIWLYTSQVPSNLCHDLSWMGLIKVSIEITQEIYIVDSEHLGCRSQFDSASPTTAP